LRIRFGANCMRGGPAPQLGLLDGAGEGFLRGAREEEEDERERGGEKLSLLHHHFFRAPPPIESAPPPRAPAWACGPGPRASPNASMPRIRARARACRSTMLMGDDCGEREEKESKKKRTHRKNTKK
jgi:hypothetical protein